MSFQKAYQLPWRRRERAPRHRRGAGAERGDHIVARPVRRWDAGGGRKEGKTQQGRGSLGHEESTVYAPPHVGRVGRPRPYHDLPPRQPLTRRPQWVRVLHRQPPRRCSVAPLGAAHACIGNRHQLAMAPHGLRPAHAPAPPVCWPPPMERSSISAVEHVGFVPAPLLAALWEAQPIDESVPEGKEKG